jgi:hypothetical protein
MKRLFCILQIFLLSGCAITGLPNIQNSETVPPDGYDVVSCFEINGAPVGGRFVRMMFPKDKAPAVQFTSDCQIIPQPLGGK